MARIVWSITHGPPGSLPDTHRIEVSQQELERIQFALQFVPLDEDVVKTDFGENADREFSELAEQLGARLQPPAE